MVIPWAGAMLLAAAGLWCWPRGRPRIGPWVPSDRGAAGQRGAALLRIGIWAVPALLVVVTPVERWAILAAAVMLVGTVVHLFRRGRRARRVRVDGMLLACAVGMMVREVEAGAPPSAAVRAAAAGLPSSLAALVLGAVEEGPLLVRSFAAGLTTRGDSGGSAVSAAGAAGSAVAPVRGNAALLVAVERLGTAVSAANRHGIALTGVLTAAAQDLRDRADAAERRVSSTAGAVMSGYVLAALPIGGLGLGVAMGAEPWSVLTGSALGGVLLVTGAALLCAGLLWADRLVRGRDD